MTLDRDTIHALENDPARHAHHQRSAELIHQRLDSAGMRTLARQAQAARSVKAKVILLRQMTDKIGEAARGVVPCRKGCSHCCHMATLISLQEAQAIAAASGVKMVTPARYNVDLTDVEKLRQRYDGVACRFLVKGSCSIYAERPLACRMHLTVEPDNALCEIVPGVKIRVPMLDTLQFDLAITQAFGGPLAMKYADIREFFPPQPRPQERP